jgi:hypothetical protein
MGGTPAATNGSAAEKWTETQQLAVPPVDRPGNYKTSVALQYRKVDQFLLNFLIGQTNTLSSPVTETAQVNAIVLVQGPGRTNTAAGLTVTAGRGHRLNPEETGALLVLGEVALLRKNAGLAEERFSNVCKTNPKAAGGFFLRAYIAWKAGDKAAARELLEKTRSALGKDWQPKGTTSEGDVQQKWHIEHTPLSRFWEGWDGEIDPKKAFAPLDARLS